VQFDPVALHASIDRLMSFRPEALYVTHFGQVRDAPRLAADLHRLIDAHAELGEKNRFAGASGTSDCARASRRSCSPSARGRMAPAGRGDAAGFRAGYRAQRAGNRGVARSQKRLKRALLQQQRGRQAQFSLSK
jgi:hypothetical protein